MVCVLTMGNAWSNSGVLHHSVIKPQNAAVENTKWLVYVSRFVPFKTQTEVEQQQELKRNRSGSSVN